MISDMMSLTATLNMRLRIAIRNLVIIWGKPVPCSSCGQKDSDCNESDKEFDEAKDEKLDHLEDCGQDLMKYAKT